MRIQEILPSTQFMLIVGSIAASGALIYGTYATTHYTPEPSTVSVSNNTQNSDWKQSLEDIQAQNPLNRLPQAPDEQDVQRLLNAATSNNLTDTVARTLLVSLSAAKAQGLGNDIPTQDQLIADAIAQINSTQPQAAYSVADITLSTSDAASLKKYGNAFMTAVARHPGASYSATLYAIGTSTDNHDADQLDPLYAIGREYAALASDLRALPTPPHISPFHLRVVNNFKRMADLFPDLEKVYSDPLRALAALQLYEALNQETFRLFINIGQELKQNGILFSKDEPGVTWNSLVP